MQTPRKDEDIGEYQVEVGESPKEFSTQRLSTRHEGLRRRAKYTLSSIMELCRFYDGYSHDAATILTKLLNTEFQKQ
jgi:hypothetical protein